VNALQSGDIDFMEIPPFELLPILEANPDIKIDTLSKLGNQTMGRMNFLLPPFDNIKVRRAALLAMNQKDVLDALIGNPKYQQVCGAIFGCGTPLESEAGAPADLTKAGNIEAAKKLLAESGYDGTPIVIMAPGDVVTLRAQPTVATQMLRQAGFKVDLQATDWQTVVTRRASQKPVSEGGWNMFFTNWVTADVMDPIASFPVGGRGKNGGWFGWAEDAKIEQLKDKYVRAATPEDRKKIAIEIQQEVYDQVIYVPLGQFLAPSAWRKSLTGVLDGPATPIFWNIDKTE
jgi:peptide/nickel transport system substrate-binding protein